MNPFTPLKYGDDVSISTTPATLTLESRYEQFVLTATVDMYFKIGASTVTVTSGHGMKVPAGAVYTISYGSGGGAATTLAYVGTGSGTMNITYGEGE